MLYVLVAIMTFLDQVSKYLAVAYLKAGETLQIIPSVMRFKYVENRGAAFGMMQNKQYVFIVITIIAVVAGTMYYEKNVRKIKNRLYDIMFVLVLSGAIGNLIDRVYRGFVVDFIDFHIIDYPVFNIADSYIVVACIFMGYDIIKTIDFKSE